MGRKKFWWFFFHYDIILRPPRPLKSLTGVKHLKIWYFLKEFIETQPFLIRFSQSLAKSLETHFVTYFEILSRNRSSYDVIMGGRTPQNLNILWKVLKKWSFYVRFSQNFAETFSTHILTYFNVLGWKQPFYDVIMGGGVNHLKIWYFFERVQRNSAIFHPIFTKFNKKFGDTFLSIFWDFKPKSIFLWRHNRGQTP